MNIPTNLPPCIGYKNCMFYRPMQDSIVCYYEWKNYCRLNEKLYKEACDKNRLAVKK